MLAGLPSVIGMVRVVFIVLKAFDISTMSTVVSRPDFAAQSQQDATVVIATAVSVHINDLSTHIDGGSLMAFVRMVPEVNLSRAETAEQVERSCQLGL
jgi:hypothetical protein